MKCIRIAGAAALVASLGVTAFAQDTFDKYSLRSPGGIAFSDFRGYEDWSVISSARTDKELKVIVGNPTIIEAFKAGAPGNGQPYPEGSRMVKMQWNLKKSTEAPFAVEVPDVPTQVFVMTKDSGRFPKTGGWGYATFNHVERGRMIPDGAGADCGHVCHVAVKSKDYVFHPYQAR